MAQPAAATGTDQARILTTAVVKAAAIMGLGQKNLAGILNLSAATVSRMHRSEYCLKPGDASWQLGLLLVRLFRGLDAMTGGDEASLTAWLHTFNTDLAAVPAEHIGTVPGLVHVADYVDAFRARI